ncbi:serine hydrolase domain-containing protein [Peribacillus frigoritolerans]|uniref:serine hydrolase domain-containing protein n=1 Tax=Peribacillus frigoritolerans TaxID=450367 RepID=UPI000FD7331F|nr:serine hydrolase [Peribacillus frigoritolerans]AZV59902.1 penicillin-binding protein [Peribacillus frigoritolerans]
MDISRNIEATSKEIEFSGVISVKAGDDLIHSSAHGYSNRADEIMNTTETRFGIASGCKLFTAIAICQLVQKGKLRFDSKLKDCVRIVFPNFNQNVTIHHLLTHTSGIPDYFDEEVMDDFEELWQNNPMYHVKGLKDFLPMFQGEVMMFQPGGRFHYNNSGYILLGLIVEELTGLEFTEYIDKNIFLPCEMKNSGYFSMDQLPKNTALGYIDEENGAWRTNVYSLPIKGSADGGAFITTSDMFRFWDGLFSNKLLNQEYTNLLLETHIATEDEGEYYGYGIWIHKKNDAIFKYHLMGYDPGVSFNSAVYPEKRLRTVITSNKGRGPYHITRAIEKEL